MQQWMATRRPPARFSTMPSFSLGPRPATNDRWLTSRNLSCTHAVTTVPLLLLLWPLQHPFNNLFPRTTWVSWYQKGKTSRDLKQATYDGVLGCSGISWTRCKQSVPCSRPINRQLHLVAQFSQAGCSCWRPTNSVKALKAQSTHRVDK